MDACELEKIIREVMKFRKDFADAYLADEVREIGLHDTFCDAWKKELRKGLKHFPSRDNLGYNIRRCELGVHYDKIIAIKKNRKAKFQAKEHIMNAFDNFARVKVTCDEERNPELRESPGLVLLKEKVPRARSHFDSYTHLGDKIYGHMYVPVIKGLEKTVHVLIPKDYILDVFFLTEDEVETIIKRADKKYGSFSFIDYLDETKK